MKIGEIFYMHFNADFFISYFVHMIVKYDMKILFPVSLFIIHCIVTLNFNSQETILFHNWVDGTANDAAHIVCDFTTIGQPGQRILATSWQYMDTCIMTNNLVFFEVYKVFG